MSHPADYADAHERHWEDADLLFREQRWANADQMYGFSAECGLKAVMQSLGMSAPGGVPRERSHRKHIQDLWPVFQTFANRRLPSRYMQMLPSGTPFADWSHHDRYADRTHFSPSTVRPHRDAANQIARLIRRWRADGTP